MAEIHPFQGIHYNPALVSEPASVICPPYDVISLQQQHELYERDAHNFIRIEYGLEQPHDDDSDNRYTRAVKTLDIWLASQILVKDDVPALYVNDHRFSHNGITYTRRSINCIVRLEDWDRNVIRPHEGTLAKAKSDRLSLLSAIQANTSPIMTLYEDPGNIIADALEQQSSNDPLFTADMANGEHHALRVITDASSIATVCNALAEQPLYIADGHHRYESALTYQRERRIMTQTPVGTEPFDYVMMTLIDFSDPGLLILPAHRLVRGLSATALENLLSGLPTFFNVQEVPLDEFNAAGQIEELLAGPGDATKFILYGPDTSRLTVLTVADMAAVRPLIPYFHTDTYQRLDVSIVDHIILEELLGISYDMVGAHVAYTNELAEAMQRVKEGEFPIALIINPVKATDIKAIADAGDRMPRKSTYFYPKIPAGIVFYRFI